MATNCGCVDAKVHSIGTTIGVGALGETRVFRGILDSPGVTIIAVDEAGIVSTANVWAIPDPNIMGRLALESCMVRATLKAGCCIVC